MRAAGAIAAVLSQTVAAESKREAPPSGLAPGRTAQRLMRPGDRLRLHPGVGGEGDEQLFVGDQIVEHRVQERRVRRGAAEIMGAEASQVEEPAQPVRVGADEGERARPPEIGRTRGLRIASISGNRA